MNRTTLRRLSWLLLALPFRIIMGEDIPKPYAFTRYQPMSDHSPFAVATAIAPPAETPNFAKDLYVANAMHSREADLVTVASSTDRNFKKYLTTAMAVDGYTIVSIDWSEKVGATKVTVSKDGQTATIGFNEALLRSPSGAGGNPPPGQPPPVKVADGNAAKDGSAPVQAAVAGQAPGTGAQPPNATKPMPIPALPAAAPRARGVIPRSPTTQPAMKPAGPPQKQS